MNAQPILPAGRESQFRRAVFIGCFALIAIGPLGAQMRPIAGARAATTDYQLVQDRQPVAVIVLPPASTAAERTAADDLRDFVELATGARLPVQTEAEHPPPSGGVAIHIGRTRALQESGLLAVPLDKEEFLVAGRTDTIFLAGEDASVAPNYPSPNRLAAGRGASRNIPHEASLERAGGTHAALVCFIERSLGGAFLWPGRLGTVLPRGDSLTARVETLRFRPPVAQRIVRNMDLNSARYITHARAKGLGEKDLLPRWEESSRWMLDRGLGGRLKVSIGHSTTGWWDKYGRTEPTLFALQPTGVRGPVASSSLNQFRSGEDVKQCTTNPRVAEIIAAEMDEHFRKHPESEYFPLAMNDGRYHGFCMCEACKALDEPQAQDVNLLFTDRAGQTVTLPYKFLTDRYAVFWMNCATTLEKKHPGKKIAVYAYGALETPPVKRPLPKNLVVAFVGPESMYYDEAVRQPVLARWDGWSALGAKLIFRPNIHYPGFGLPVGYSRKLDADLKRFYRSGSLLGTDFDALHMSFGTQGHNQYVLTRLLWSPETPRDEIMAEFCGKAFGAAAAPMRSYFELLEDATEDVAVQKEGHEQWLVRYERRLVARDGDRILGLFRQASATAPKGSPEWQRVEFFREGYHYAELVQAAVVATLRRARGEISEESCRRAVEQLQAEFDRHMRDWVVDRIAIGDGILRRSWAQILSGIAGKDITLQRGLE